ncbi:MAG: FKBP-type peptidyl-prolyl cis-trans isomerase [Proteobacteria bacterium]|nr:FKBP-type peptidyl-prolyl cis-trans isomerase [Pseudomonadota bacterium]
MRPIPVLLAALCVVPAAIAQSAPVTLSSGVVYESLVEGTGNSPKPGDTIKVHYRGIGADGKEIDSSYKRNEPAEFPVNRVIPCWREGVQRMKEGGKAKLTCPPETTYGMRGSSALIPSYVTMQFEIELLSVR